MAATRFVSALFTAAALASLILACGASGPPPGSAEALYVDFGCAKCHGPDRQGQRSGPPLVNLSDRWDESTLVSYLRDPRSFVESNPRLSYLDEQYAIAMPAYDNKPEEDLRKLAQLMLGG
jgi:mono/diheme cytochrome c family protein